MEKYVTNEGDIALKHRLGCQVVYILFGVIMLGMACSLLFIDSDDKKINYIYSAIVAVISFTALWFLCRRVIKERIHNIPALVITDRSIIVSRKKSEYNEIPFDVIQSFRLHREREEKSSTTYLRINYKAPADGEKFKRVNEINLNGLNMMDQKLINLLQERLKLYNERYSMQ